MINLAGNEECDKYIIEELKKAHISLNKVEIVNKEVAYTIKGQLNDFEFRRAWYYWVVSGKMPLEYAKYLYENFKDLNIRVAGHCGNPPPEEWCEPENYQDKIKSYCEKWRNKELSEDELNKTCNEIKQQGPQFVMWYHIDTQEGLNKFAEVVYNNNIIG